MCLEVLVVVLDQEKFDLLSEEREQLFGRLGLHEGSRDGDFGLLKREGFVAVQYDTADSEVGSS